MKHSNQFSILNKVKAISKRWLVQKMFDAASVGLFVGGVVALLGLVFGLVGMKCLYLAAALGGITGIIVAIRQRPSVDDTARLIDHCQSLADRVSTSIQILKRGKPNEIEELQLADTEERLAHVHPGNVIAYRVPRIFFAAVALYVVVAILSCVVFRANQGLLRVLGEKSGMSEICERTTTRNDAGLNLVPKENRQLLSDKTKNKILTAVSQATHFLPEDKILDSLGSEIQSPLATLSKNEFSLREHIAAWTKLETTLHAMTQHLIDDISDKPVQNEPGIPSKKAPERSTKKSTDRQTAVNGLKEATALVELEKAAFIESLHNQSLLNEQDASWNNPFDPSSNNMTSKAAGEHQETESQTGNENWSRESGRSPDSNSPEHASEKAKSKTRIEQVSGLPGTGPSRSETIPGSKNAEAKKETLRSYKALRAQYSKEVEQAMENETIPVSRRQMIRKYFDSLDEDDTKPAN
ncbi:MAG: hypothetical protein Q4G59_01500 [Planctomycetia bacterium]|nr:hypothetical protein [Planctomycetia bacterium]